MAEVENEINRGAMREVCKLIEKTPGVLLYPDDLTAALELPVNTIRQALVRITSKNLLPGLERLGNGIYRYTPNKVVESEKLFEQIAITKSGTVIVQDAEGNLYRLEELS